MSMSESSSMFISILLGISLSIIAILTSFGNIVVLLAFYCDKKLRTINDYFILNMAIADFFVGCFCIPFYIPFSINQLWPFGRLFCKIWVTVDDVSTMASVINIVAISVNRYWSIAYPISYRKYVKQHFVYIVMAMIWFLSFINFAPGIWLLGIFNEETNVSRSDCSGDYNNSFVYMLIAQFNYFIWPFIVVCVLNMLLMLNIWKRSRKMSRYLLLSNHNGKNKDEFAIGSSLVGTSKDIEDDQQTFSILPRIKHSSIEKSQSIIVEDEQSILQKENCKKKILLQHNGTTNPIKHVSSSNTKSSFQTRCSSRSSCGMIYSNRRSTNTRFSTTANYRSETFLEYQVDNDTELPRIILNESNHPPRPKSKSEQIRTKQSRIIRDRKAARSLFILVMVFLIFLFPYVICATASTAGAKISPVVFEISFWLLWLNSTCNPFLYPFIQIKYRKAYLKLFESCRQCSLICRRDVVF